MRTPNTECCVCGKPLYRRPKELARVRHVACLEHCNEAQERAGLTAAQLTALASWVEMVPMHKFLWGGDCVYVEETDGAFLLARQVVADALYDKIEDGWLDEAAALEFARGMFHDSAAELFEI